MKPPAGKIVTGKAAASVSDLNDVSTAQRNGSSHAAASTMRIRSAAMRDGWNRGVPVRPWRATAPVAGLRASVPEEKAGRVAVVMTSSVSR